MIRFRDKPKVKAANTNTSADDLAHSKAPTAAAAEDAVEPRPEVQPEKSEDAKQ